jgi:signal transduction histidine kinase
LFEKYGQFNLRSQGKTPGRGLGLYFCKLAATGMGGTILADDHPKGGAVFSIKLNKAKG